MRHRTQAKESEGTVDRALTRRQAARMTGYAEKTLANLSLLGEGPPMRKHRGRCLYLESEVLAWLRSLPVSGGTGAAA
jgi:helix-turn-helix protein